MKTARCSSGVRRVAACQQTSRKAGGIGPPEQIRCTARPWPAAPHHRAPTATSRAGSHRQGHRLRTRDWRRLFEHHVRVGAGNAEGVDPGHPWPVARPATGSRWSGRASGSSAQGTRRVRLHEVQAGRELAVPQASAALIRPAMPAAASVWPMLVLTDPIRQARRPRGQRRGPRRGPRSSTGSPARVPVPCAST